METSIEDARFEFDRRVGMLTAIAVSMQTSDPIQDPELEREMWFGIEQCLRDLRRIVGPALEAGERLELRQGAGA